MAMIYVRASLVGNKQTGVRRQIIGENHRQTVLSYGLTTQLGIAWNYWIAVPRTRHNNEGQVQSVRLYTRMRRSEYCHVTTDITMAAATYCVCIVMRRSMDDRTEWRKGLCACVAVGGSAIQIYWLMGVRRNSFDWYSWCQIMTSRYTFRSDWHLTPLGIRLAERVAASWLRWLCYVWVL